jgi:small subunit ribosomal protein S18
MARGGDRDRDRDRKRGSKDAGKRLKKKVCVFCKEHIEWVDYKDVNLLRRFMSDRGKIRARRVSGNCSQHQREVAVAIKTARELALLPYVQRSAAERTGPRGRGRDALIAPVAVPENGDEEDIDDFEVGEGDGDEAGVGLDFGAGDGDGGGVPPESGDGADGVAPPAAAHTAETADVADTGAAETAP